MPLGMLPIFSIVKNESSGLTLAALDLSGWWRASYTGAPLVGQASAGASGGRDFGTAVDPTTGAAVNGYTSIEFDGTQYLISPDDNTDFLSGVGSFFCLFYADVAFPSVNDYSDGCFFTDPTNAETTFGFSSAGVGACIYDGAYKRLSVPCSVEAWHLAQFKFDGTNLKGRIDDGAWSSIPCGNYASVTPSAVYMGRAYAGANLFNGRILEMGLSDTVLSDNEFDSILTYCETRYALTLTTFTTVEQPLTGWWNPDFVSAPWVSSVLNPRTFSEGTNPPVAGTLVGDYKPALFDGTNDILTASGTSTDYIPLASTSLTIGFIVNVTLAPDASIMGDVDGNLYVEFSDSVGDGSGTSHVRIHVFDGSFLYAQAEIADGWSTGAWHFVQVRLDGTNVQVRIDDNAWVTGDPLVGGLSCNNALVLGTGAAIGGFFSGSLLATFIASTSLSDGTLDSIGTFYQTRYGLNFGFSASPVNPNTLFNITGLWQNSFGYGTSPWVGGATTYFGVVSAPSVGAPLNGFDPANFDGATNYLSTDQLMSSYANDNSGSGWVLFKAETAGAISAPGNRVSDEGLLVQGGGGVTWGIAYSNNGICHFLYDGAYQEIVVYASLNEFHLVQFKWNGTNMYVRIDRGPWLTKLAGSCSTIQAGGYMYLGTGYAASQFFDGDVAEVGLTDIVIDDAGFENIVEYVETKYALTFPAGEITPSLALSGWWAPNFTAVPWVSSATVGTSLGHTLDTATTDPVAGSAVNGFIPFSFDGTMSLQTTVVAWDDLIEPTLSDTGSIFILFYGRSPPAPAGAYYDNPSFVCDGGGGSVGVGWSTSGVGAWHYDGTAFTYPGLTVPASPDEWHLAQIRWNATTLEVRIDGGPWLTEAIDSAAQATTGFLRVGKSWDNSAGLDADILEIGFAIPRLSDDDFNVIKTYCEDRYSLDLSSFNPMNYSPSAYYREPNYVGGGGSGTWTASTGTDVAQSVLAPDDLNGAPDFEGSTDSGLENAVPLSTFYGTGDHYWFAIVDVESITSTDATLPYNNEAIWCDATVAAGGYAGGHFYTDGGGNYYVQNYEYSSGAPKKAVAALPAGSGRVVVQGKKDGGILYIKVDSGAWVAGDACGTPDSGAFNLRIGQNYNQTKTIDGIIRAVGFFADIVQDDTFAANIVTWAAAEFP